MTTTGDMTYRTLGRTGERVSMIGLGGFHIGIPDEQESIAIIRAALDNGMNFLDNCWGYHDGGSEIKMGKALRDGYRDKAFLMTKIDGRSKDVAAHQIDVCLRRLQVDTIDLMQFHEVLRMEDPDWIFGPNGAMEAVLEAKQAGKIRYVGFTGHKDPAMHLNMLRVAAANGFTFDAAQMPLGALDHHYHGHSFEELVVPRLIEQGTAVLAMKTLAGGRTPGKGGITAMECLHYALSLPTSVVITGCQTMSDLNQALEAARTYHPLSQDEIDAILAKTASAGATGEFEPFKTTLNHDSTTRRPEIMWSRYE